MAYDTAQSNGTGRRKTSVARVYLRPGNGRFIVNKRDLGEYFPRKILVRDLLQPLTILNVLDSYDVIANVRGGGTTGQAGAIRLGLARALVKISLKNRAPLKVAGMLTRDARKVERKKYGQPGARRRFQFSKR
ncbi:MAG: 30S ribosomal protein S9 [Deltaproteobacteria bacterium]|nr:30S ribosomal protein S9 [Deltaproteobacteria bacterium]